MLKKNNNNLIIVTFIIIGFLLWFFAEVVFIILFAVVLSILGQPIIKMLDRIKTSRFRFPHTLSTSITLIILIGFFGLLFLLVIPPVIMQAKQLADINISAIQESLKEPLDRLQMFLASKHLVPQGQQMDDMLGNEIVKVFNKINLVNTFTNVVGFAGKFVIDVFCVLFITFFFLKDENLFYKSVMLFTPPKYHHEMENVLGTSKKILSRYFAGLLLEMFLVGLMVSVGLYIFGVKMAFFIGFVTGLMVVIPYIGVLISLAVAIVICITGNLQADFYSVTMMAIYKTLAVFAIAKLIDDFLLQPLIYSNSVKAHPLEIFLVIIISGTIAGVIGMMLAIPAYTLIRIVAREFLSGFNVVKKITENL